MAKTGRPRLRQIQMRGKNGIRVVPTKLEEDNIVLTVYDDTNKKFYDVAKFFSQQSADNFMKLLERGIGAGKWKERVDESQATSRDNTDGSGSREKS